MAISVCLSWHAGFIQRRLREMARTWQIQQSEHKDVQGGSGGGRVEFKHPLSHYMALLVDVLFCGLPPVQTGCREITICREPACMSMFWWWIGGRQLIVIYTLGLFTRWSSLASRVDSWPKGKGREIVFSLSCKSLC